MSKNLKILIICISIMIILGIIIGIIIFTDLGSGIRVFLYDTFFTPKETIKLENQEHIKITYRYGYREQDESFDIDVTDENFIKMVQDDISNHKLNNYSSQIGLAIMGLYQVDLGNNINFLFDYYDDDGYVMMYNGTKHFLTKINPEILSKVVQIVDEKLTGNTDQYKTDKISFTKMEKGNNDSIAKEENVDISEKTAIEYIADQCKEIYTKKIDYEPNLVNPDYKINFNNNIELWIYKATDKGWMYKNETLLEAYNLNVFETILENSFNNIEQKRQMFTTDKIEIISPNKQMEITDADTIEKITSNLIYANIYRPDWLENYDINGEYDTGIKVKINDNEFLIPGDKSIGNRYVIDKDKKINLCFTLTDIEKFINELLGIKEEKYEGAISTGI